MIDFNAFYQLIAQNRLSSWLEVLPAQLIHWQRDNKHNEQFIYWQKILSFLPDLKPDKLDLKTGVLAEKTPALTAGEKKAIEARLRILMPWRKGPFDLYGIHINTEWRSDWKWQRVLPHIEPLNDKLVLDVGCGSGYHLWRMRGEGAKLVVGIDPTTLFLHQFLAMKKLLGNDNSLHFLPIGIETLPKLEGFDTVFSMGVLYHRRSPLDHLLQLKDQLVPDGQLVLETLVIEGNVGQILVPQDRYAKMKNVYFIPSIAELIHWLKKCGFCDIKLVDLNYTTIEEQRSTDWMTNESLFDYLDANDPKKTIEGYPAPLRAVITAKK